MTLMQPIMCETIPSGETWVYEVKYDGFRCVLTWTNDSVQLTSRNGTDLSGKFPEIIDACRSEQSHVQSYLPLELDGELAILNHTYQANFALIQKRSRLQDTEKINEQAAAHPASFMVFDLLASAGSSRQGQPFAQRKHELALVFGNTNQLGERLQYIACTTDAHALWQTLVTSKGEGLVAKQRDSLYQPGKNIMIGLKSKIGEPLRHF
ncbi:hypothetical protein GCM10028778_23590 [Barrientosiimonas marina]